MIEIGRLPNQRTAQAFIDYLKGLGIDCDAQVDELDIRLVIHQSEFEHKARQEFALFLQEPYNDKYLQASWSNGDTQVKLDYAPSALGLVQTLVTQSGPFTLIILLLSIITFAGMKLGLGELVYTSISFFGATQEIDLTQFWRALTPTLLHFSVMHIMFNLLWWWYLGGKIELKLGAPKLILILLSAGILANVVQYYVSGPNFGGLSGVVYALVGYTWLMGQRRPQAGLFLPNSYLIFMLVWLVLGFTDLLGMPIANGAHLAGLLAGLAQGAFDSRKST
jgi:GlpG protein